MRCCRSGFTRVAGAGAASGSVDEGRCGVVPMNGSSSTGAVSTDAAESEPVGSNSRRKSRSSVVASASLSRMI
jgi:hypothetical protein